MKSKWQATKGKRMWVIRAGIDGEAHSRFLKNHVICLADPGIGDLRKIPHDRESFYTAYRRLKPNEARGTVAGIGGKFFRFVHEMALGDLIVYPSLADDQIYLGTVAGDYKYIKGPGESFPHVRAVEWLCTFEKSQISEKARRELGAARTFFAVNRHADEIKDLAMPLMSAGSGKKK